MLWCHNCVYIAWYKHSNWPVTASVYNMQLVFIIIKLSTLLEAEFLGNYTMNGWGEPLYQMKEAAIPDGKAPESFDWRDHGKLEFD